MVNLLVNFWVLVTYPWWAFRRARAAGRTGWLALELEGRSLEVRPPARFGYRWRSEPPALYEVKRALARAQRDPRVTGVVVTLRGFQGGGASVDSWRGVLAGVREAGKRLVIYLPDGAGTREYQLATASDLLIAGPDARVAPVGFSVETLYFKQALDRVGLAMEVFARGDFKTAGEPFVRESMSEPQRRQLTELLEHQFNRFLQGVAEGRAVPRDQVEAWVQQGPFAAERAHSLGLVDALAYEDQVKPLLNPPVPEQEQPVSVTRYARRSASPFRPLVRRGYLAVVPVHGVITSEPLGWSSGADEQSFASSLRRVREDTRALGLLLHIDSRGGSALASARMLHEVRRCAEKKPVVAYFSDTAASGGYMIGLGAHEIVAQASTITGSIGVVAARLVVQTLAERLGLSVERVKRGERADMFSPFRFMQADVRAAFEAELDEVYRRFVEQVARGRSLSIEQVEPLAGGRVWSGEHAQRLGLVDSLGDVAVAAERLRARIDTPRARVADLRLVSIKRRRLPRLGLGPDLGWFNHILRDPNARDLLAFWCDPRIDPVLAWEPALLGSPPGP
ncbi:MAG TPA: signal peptide peptidase SppA [Polyangiaceae bacterium]|nr:signal peptide peptidase SppA [Polyangiaceae bacterium]